MANRIPAEVFTPGDFIQEEIDARGWTQGDLAAIIGRPIQAVNELISGKRAVTVDTANALGDAFGTGPELWMNLESTWRLSQSEKPSVDVARRSALYSKAPVKELVRRGWVETSDDFSQLEPRVLKFMGLANLDDTPAFRAAARMSASYQEQSPSQVAWLRCAEKLAASVKVATFNKTKFADRVSDLHDLAVSDADVRRIPKVVADLGVRLVVVEHLPGTKIDGAAFWLDQKSPVIALSMRYDRIDYLWHTLGHELGHIAKGDGLYYDENIAGEDARADSERPEAERLADEFASNLLIEQQELDDFIARVRPLYSRKQIVGFANRVGVHPGIVVGQLQFRGEIGYWHSRPLLAKVRGALTDNAMTDGWRHSSGLA